jgi:hypothetical protein
MRLTKVSLFIERFLLISLRENPVEELQKKETTPFEGWPPFVRVLNRCRYLCGALTAWIYCFHIGVYIAMDADVFDGHAVRPIINISRIR